MLESLRPGLGRLNRKIDVEFWYPRRLHVPAATLVCVYRVANAANVEKMARIAAAEGWQVRLWALDDVAVTLERFTVGHGPGTRFQLINQLIEAEPIEAASYVVVADDDVTFERRGIADLLSIAHVVEADLAQPAHTVDSVFSWLFTLSAPRCVARRTSFVEIGPVFSVSPKARPHVLPFPEGGMGWGVEFQWAALQKQGIKLAIVDAVTVCHHGRVAQGYDLQQELAAVTDRAAEAGLHAITDLQVEHGRWRPWHRGPAQLQS